MAASVYDTAWASISAGWLPKWLLFISLVSVGNSIQSYTSLKGTREVYAGTSSSASSSSKKPTSTSPVTPLSARTFGTWTFLSSVVRLQAALAIHDPVAYRLSFATFLVAAAHFGIEWLGFGTARWGRGLAGPVFVSLGTATWMALTWTEYVRV